MQAVVFGLNGTLLQAQSGALYPSVDELLPILRRLGIKLAVLTSGGVDSVALLETTQIKPYFASVVWAERAKHTKPHPAGLRLALEELGVKPEEAVMVGDKAVDIVTGKNAGVAKTIGIAHGFGAAEDLQRAGADHLIDDIATLLDVLE